VPHVVVVGAGFGGLKAVEELRARHPGVTITLVAPSPRFLYWPSLVWVPSGWREPEELTVDVRDWLFRRRAAFEEDRVTGVRDGGRTVVTAAGELAADGLIVASGATTPATIPGSEHVHTICGGLDEARGLRDHLRRLAGGRIVLGFADNPAHPPAARGTPVVELAFTVDEQLRRERRRAHFRLDLILPPSEDAAHGALAGLVRRLRGRGVAVHPGRRIERFAPDRVVTDKDEYPSDLTIFSPALSGPAWLAASDLPATASGHVAVDDRARAAGLERVYAVGDAAAFPGPAWQTKQAHTAELQAETAARNLARELEGRPARERVRRELIHVVDGLGQAAVVYRDGRGEWALPPTRFGHYLKLGLEQDALRKYAPAWRPPRRGRGALPAGRPRAGFWLPRP
jgi:sulfide:quinone oxidoreductase